MSEQVEQALAHHIDGREPTLFADVTPDMAIAREEVFGPVTVAIPFRRRSGGHRNCQ
jgi:acyl-CoA reductase-like NAD-dependent aldehyde dehydrogenase